MYAAASNRLASVELDAPWARTRGGIAGKMPARQRYGGESIAFCTCNNEAEFLSALGIDRHVASHVTRAFERCNYGNH